MRIGDCKQGDKVWIVEMVDKRAIQIEVLGESTDTTYLMPSKNVKVLTDAKNYKWLTTVFYSSECYETEKEAIEISKKLKDDVHKDYRDSVAMTLFSAKQNKIDCLEGFIRQLEWKGVIGPNDFAEFEKQHNENLEHLKNPLINDLLGYGK